MAEHAGRLVTKDELMDALWAGRIVTDGNLVQCVHEIRRAFQDTDRLVLKPRRDAASAWHYPPTPPRSEPGVSLSGLRAAMARLGQGQRPLRKAAASANAPGSPWPSSHSSTCLRIASKSEWPFGRQAYRHSQPHGNRP
jgi:hypothetical protein